MLPSLREERPPYAEYYREAVKDARASISAGHAVYKDVDYVRLTPIGSRDNVVHEVVSWFDSLRARVAGGRFKQSWLDDYQGAYEAWRRGEEPPVHGTSVKNWSVATPAEARMMVDLNILTVEDMAQANDEALRRLGMGARELQQKAQAFLDQASGGKLGERIVELEQENKSLRVRNESLELQVKQLKAMLPTPLAVEREKVTSDDDIT